MWIAASSLAWGGGKCPSWRRHGRRPAGREQSCLRFWRFYRISCQWCAGGGGMWEGEITLLLQRGGQAVPAPVSIPSCRQCDTQHTTPIISYSILPRLRGVVADVVPSVAKTVRKRPTFPQPRRSSTPMSLARVITSPTPTNLKLSHSHTQSLQNGCPDFNRTRCAPIHLCRREETITFRVPEVAAGGSEATAILGICRSYARLKLWKAIELQAESLTERSEGEEVHRGP